MEICTRPVPGEEEVGPESAWSFLQGSFLHAQGALQIPKDVGKGAHRWTLLIVTISCCQSRSSHGRECWRTNSTQAVHELRRRFRQLLGWELTWPALVSQDRF
jgi:hypothetical protein